MTKTRKILAIVLAVLVAGAFFGAGYLTNELIKPDFDETNWMLETIDENALVFDEETGEIRKITDEEYAKATIKGLQAMGLLDGYSAYYNAEEYSDVISTSKGNAYGIGVGFYKKSNVVGKVSFNSPLYKATNGIDVSGKTITALRSKSGEVHTVNSYTDLQTGLSGYANGVEFYITIDGNDYLVSKEAFVESYVRYVDNTVSIEFSSDYGEKPQDTRIAGNPNLPSDTAYIQFTAFNGNAYDEFVTVMNYLKNSGKTKLILDLRNNGGGYMDKLTAIASLFIDNGGKKNNVVAISKNNDNVTTEFKTSANTYIPLNKMVVLANENTASASECLIGALVHYGALSMDNIVVTNADYDGTGTNATYGKGIMQTTYPSGSGTAVKLTTARIYWPDGETCIHGVGVKATAQNSTAYSDALTRALELIG